MLNFLKNMDYQKNIQQLINGREGVYSLLVFLVVFCSLIFIHTAYQAIISASEWIFALFEPYKDSVISLYNNSLMYGELVSFTLIAIGSLMIFHRNVKYSDGNESSLKHDLYGGWMLAFNFLAIFYGMCFFVNYNLGFFLIFTTISIVFLNLSLRSFFYTSQLEQNGARRFFENNLDCSEFVNRGASSRKDESTYD